jgi:uncharacterized damage-inducible protein DinB
MPLPDNIVVESIWRKVSEQIEGTEHLIRLIPPGQMQWHPQSGSPDIGHLLGHLLECLAGFYAVFHAAFPRELDSILELRALPVNHFCPGDEALSRIPSYAAKIEEGFALCSDDDLRRMIPTVFAPAESLATLLLGNLEHLINHKYQLFMYLKLLGVPVTTKDIYRWRQEASAAPSLKRR